jgi:hypothetical protein
MVVFTLQVRNECVLADGLEGERAEVVGNHQNHAKHHHEVIPREGTQVVGRRRIYK